MLTCLLQVALEVIEELCYEMGLHRLEAIEEYAIFVVTNRGQRTHTHTPDPPSVASEADPLPDHIISGFWSLFSECVSGRHGETPGESGCYWSRSKPKLSGHRVVTLC